MLYLTLRAVAALIRERRDRLRRLSKAGDTAGLVIELRTSLLRRLAGVGSDELYAEALSGTKRLVGDYLDEVVTQLKRLARTKELDPATKYAFFHETRHSFGRSAVCPFVCYQLSILCSHLCECFYS